MTLNLLKSAIGLAVTSAILSLLLFLMAAPLAGVFELSVCAGLITVVFISVISLTKPLTSAEARARDRSRVKRFIFLPILIVIVGAGLYALRPQMDLPLPPAGIFVGGETVLAALKLGVHLAHRAGRISDHDVVVGGKLAWILAGGSRRAAGEASEPELLDLEREAFLSLCGEAKTLERIGHTLKTGKVLRN